MLSFEIKLVYFIILSFLLTYQSCWAGKVEVNWDEQAAAHKITKEVEAECQKLEKLLDFRTLVLSLRPLCIREPITRNSYSIIDIFNSGNGPSLRINKLRQIAEEGDMFDCSAKTFGQITSYVRETLLSDVAEKDLLQVQGFLSLIDDKQRNREIFDQKLNPIIVEFTKMISSLMGDENYTHKFRVQDEDIAASSFDSERVTRRLILLLTQFPDPACREVQEAINKLRTYLETKMKYLRTHMKLCAANLNFQNTRLKHCIVAEADEVCFTGGSEIPASYHNTFMLLNYLKEMYSFSFVKQYEEKTKFINDIAQEQLQMCIEYNNRFKTTESPAEKFDPEKLRLLMGMNDRIIALVGTLVGE